MHLSQTLKSNPKNNAVTPAKISPDFFTTLRFSCVDDESYISIAKTHDLRACLKPHQYSRFGLSTESTNSCISRLRSSNVNSYSCFAFASSNFSARWSHKASFSPMLCIKSTSQPRDVMNCLYGLFRLGLFHQSHVFLPILYRVRSYTCSP